MPRSQSFSNLISRRTFVQQGALLFGASALSAARIAGANGTVRLAIVGMGWWGSSRHIRDFSRLPNARIVALCDVDSERLQKAAADAIREGYIDQSITLESDYRRLLERKDIDAVILATPNHWHALQTIWACQASKDVYVEKPASHSIWEGEQMIKAARRYNRVVQVGLQNSSIGSLTELSEWLQEGHIGKIEAIHGVWYSKRESIGKRSKPLRPPETVDYDLWLGPAQDKPIYRDQFHYDWHWNWNTGNGDLGNLGSHLADLVRKVLKDPTADGEIVSIGQRFLWDDFGDSPNAHLASFKLGDVPVVLELNNHPAEPGRPAGPAFMGTRQGLAILCEGGHFMGLGRGRAFDQSGKVIRQFRGPLSHQQDFIDAVISRKSAQLTAEMERGYESTKVTLLGNVAHRLGVPTEIDQIRDQIQTNPALLDAFDRYQAQMERLGVDFARQPWILGKGLNFDDASGRFTGEGNTVAAANQFLEKPNFRPAFDVPAL